MRKDVYTFLQKQIVHIAYDGSFLYVVTIRTSYPRLWVNNRKIYVETNGNDWLFAITWGNCHGLTNRLTLLWYQFLWICRYHIFALKRHLIFNIFQERLIEIKLFIYKIPVIVELSQTRRSKLLNKSMACLIQLLL